MAARKPSSADEILICLAHRVVVHHALSRERTHTRQFLASLKLARRNEEHNLLSELLSQWDLALLTQYDLHWACPASLCLSNFIGTTCWTFRRKIQIYDEQTDDVTVCETVTRSVAPIKLSAYPQ